MGGLETPTTLRRSIPRLFLLYILALAFFPVGGSVSHCQLETLVAEFDMLLHVVAGAIGGNAGLGLSA